MVGGSPEISVVGVVWAVVAWAMADPEDEDEGEVDGRGIGSGEESLSMTLGYCSTLVSVGGDDIWGFIDCL